MEQTDALSMKYGRLTFLRDVGTSKDHHIVSEYMCDCGNKRISQKTRVVNGQITQCRECAKKEGDLKNTRHGKRGTRAYASWMSMKDRCLNPKSKDYSRWGGRGLAIYPPWIHDFQSFYDYMGERGIGQSIERIDNDIGYFPGNVKWATPKEQARNHHNSVYITWVGKRKHIVEIANELGISKGAAHSRFKRGKLNEPK